MNRILPGLPIAQITSGNRTYETNRIYRYRSYRFNHLGCNMIISERTEVVLMI